VTESDRGYLARQREYWNERAHRTRHATGAVGFLRPLEIALTAFALRGPAVLDAGCGDGAVAVWCRRARRRLRITGLDYSDAMVERARARGIDAVVGDMAALPWPDPQFATAYAVRSLKNILDEDDQARALRELARVASKRIIIVDSVRTAATAGEPEFNLYPTAEAIVGTLEGEGFRLRWSIPLRDWYWLLRRRDRFGNERMFVFDRDRSA
jgi:SAM-dependent methyltransferase